MKFVYILNSKKKLVDFCRIGSDRYDILGKLILFKIQEELLPIELKVNEIEKNIEILLIERDLNPLDIVDYKGRFLENEIFELKTFKGYNLKLCNSGFGNKIIFLINLYDSLLKDKLPHFLLFTNTHAEFKIKLESLI